METDNKKFLFRIEMHKRCQTYAGSTALINHKSMLCPVLYNTWINRYYDVVNGTYLSLIPSSSGYYYFKKEQYIYGHFDAYK